MAFWVRLDRIDPPLRSQLFPKTNQFRVEPDAILLESGGSHATTGGLLKLGIGWSGLGEPRV
jgi:hypothetical protein